MALQTAEPLPFLYRLSSLFFLFSISSPTESWRFLSPCALLSLVCGQELIFSQQSSSRCCGVEARSSPAVTATPSAQHLGTSADQVRSPHDSSSAAEIWTYAPSFHSGITDHPRFPEMAPACSIEALSQIVDRAACFFFRFVIARSIYCLYN